MNAEQRGCEAGRGSGVDSHLISGLTVHTVCIVLCISANALL